MGKNNFLTMLSFFILSVSIFGLSKGRYFNEILLNYNVLPPTAAISGTTAVCLNETSPQITFTGADGNAPYIFTYSINSGANLTATSIGNSATIEASTANVGTYVYRLISVSDSTGDVTNESGTATVTVNSLPTVDFSFNNDGACAGTQINFTSTASGSGNLSYDWDFGDGGRSTSSNPSHRFVSPGCGTSTINVVLTVTDELGCSNTVSKTISMLNQPDIDFKDANFSNPAQYFNNCANTTSNENFTITVENISNATCVTGYTINWGDGTSEPFNSATLSHTYTYADTFRMQITGTGNNGCETTKTYIVKNASNPQGNIVSPGSTQNICAPAEIGFTISSNWGANSIDTVYDVNYGDGTTATFLQEDMIATSFYNTADPANSTPYPIPHTYTTSNCPNDFEATISIRNSCAITPGNSGGIRILQNADAEFEVDDNACLSLPVIFTNTSGPASAFDCSNFIEFTWNFGDGSPEIKTFDYSSVSHTYTSLGDFNVTLTANNDICAVASFDKDICIEPPLSPLFTLNTNNGCSPLDIQTTNTTDVTSSCGDETYLWEVDYSAEFCATGIEQWTFTNGTDENSAEPAFNFITAGIYTVTLTTTNSCGGNSISETVEVKQPPTATIDAIANTCGSATINPVASVNSCAPASQTPSYSWSFPGGSPSTANTLDPGTITYASPGDYSMSFSITNSCTTTTDTEEFTVNPVPILTNTNFTQTICSGTETAAINLTSDIAGTTFTWTASAPPTLNGFTASGNSDVIPIQTIFNTNTTSEAIIFTVTPALDGCDGTPVDFTISVDPAPAFTSQPQPETICINGAVTPLSVTVNGSGTPEYQWYSNTNDDTATGTLITGETNPTYTPPNTTAGILYYYNVVSFNSSGAGCDEIISNTARTEVVNGVQIDTQPTITQSICNGGNAPTALSVVHSGGAGTITYQWFLNTTNSNTGGTSITGATNINYTPPTFTTSGTYYYYLVISANGSGCDPVLSEVSEIIVEDDPVISNQPIENQILCQNVTPEDLEVTASGGLGNIYTYQWFSNTTNSNSGGTPISSETNSVFTPPTNIVGTFYYYAMVSQAGAGCSVVSDTSEVNVNLAPNFTTQPLSNTYCLGDSLNALSVTYNNGAGTPSITWYSNTVNDVNSGTLISGENAATYNPPSSTVGTMYYFAIIRFSTGGCSEITSNIAEVTINQTPSISSKSGIICSGNSFNISPENANSDITPTGTTYTWANPIISPAGTITGASNANAPQSSISQTLTNTSTSPSTVTYTVTPVSGICVGADFDVVITVNPSISITKTQVNSNCFSANAGSITIEIFGGVPFSTGNPYQITWSGPNGYANTSEAISNLEPGDYTVNILDDGGCPYSENFSITEPNELIFSNIVFNPETISCFGANDGEIDITILGGTLPYSFNWTRNGTDFSTSEDLSNLSPGEYEIAVTDANNCPPISTNFSVIEPDELEVTLSNQVDIICFGDATGEIITNISGGRTIEISPGVFDYSYAWTGPNGFTSNLQNISDLFSGTYNLTVTDKSGCTDTLEVTLIQTEEIIIDYSFTEIECYGDNNASITINGITGGNAPYAVTWSNFGTGMTQTNLSADTYIITVTDNTNCEKQATIIIDEAPIFRMTPITQNVSCFGENDGRITLNLEGGINPVTVDWDDDTTAGTERNNIGPGTYTVTITDGTPCVLSETFTITEPDNLTLSANTTNALDCDDANSGTINVIVTGGTPPFTYSWSNGATSEDLNAVPPGNYSITVLDANACEVEGNWSITRFEPMELEVITQTDFNCATKTVKQSFVAKVSGGVPPYSINWSDGAVSGTNGEIMNTSQNGLIIIDVTDSLGCTTNYSYQVDIPVLGEPDFNLSSTAFDAYRFHSIEDAITFVNTASGDFESVSWDFGDGNFSVEENPSHTYINEGHYTITQTVTYPFGCTYTKQETVLIEKGYSLMMPNAFTPNGDLINAYFVPESVALTDMTLNIFDTWGSLIYSETGDSIKGWDGKINDTEAENGNYYYTLTAKTFYGKTVTRKGAFASIK